MADKPSHRILRGLVVRSLVCGVLLFAAGGRSNAAGHEAGSPALATRPAPLPPAPDAEVVLNERRVLWRQFSADYRLRSAPDRQALAVKFLGLASGDSLPSTNPAAPDAAARRYALLGEAFDLALAAHDVPLALRAMQVTGRSFATDRTARFKALAAVAELPELSDDRAGARLIARRWLDLADEATAGEDYVTAAAATARAAAAADNAHDPRLVATVAAASDRLNDAMDQSLHLARAQKTLAVRPDDPEANLVLGKFLCSVKGDWEQGMARLAMSEDSKLKSLAETQKGGAASASQWTDLGDAFLAAATPPDSRGAAFAQALRRRARVCFETALPLASADEKPGIHKRLHDLTGAANVREAPGYDFQKLAESARNTRKSPPAGGEGGGEFEDLPAAEDRPGYLVGFRYSTMNWSGHTILKSLRPLYLTAHGQKEGKAWGSNADGEIAVRADDGYAVGGLVVRAGGRIDAVKVVFMRVHGAGLDPDDSYESEWLGGEGGTESNPLGNDGRPVVGIHGRCGAGLDAVGLIQAQ